jgi:hypothetical protein
LGTEAMGVRICIAVLSCNPFMSCNSNNLFFTTQQF